MSEDNPDHSSYSVMKAQDEDGNWLTVLVDGAGRMIGVMKGFDGTNLQDIKVDTLGHMEARMIYPDSVYDALTGVTAFCVTRAGGKDTIVRRYTANQTDLGVIAQHPDYRIQINGVYMATKSSTGEVYLDFEPSGIPIFSLYASKYSRDSANDIAIMGADGDSVVLNSTTGDNEVTLIINYRRVLPVDWENPFLTVALWQANPATGTAHEPQNINDGDVGTIAIFDAVGEEAEVDLGKKYYIDRYRHYGYAGNNADGFYNLYYYDDDLETWVVWVPGISTRVASWSSWIDVDAILAQKIKIRCMVRDSNNNESICGELELRGLG